MICSTTWQTSWVCSIGYSKYWKYHVEWCCVKTWWRHENAQQDVICNIAQTTQSTHCWLISCTDMHCIDSYLYFRLSSRRACHAVGVAHRYGFLASKDVRKHPYIFEAGARVLVIRLAFRTALNALVAHTTDSLKTRPSQSNHVLASDSLQGWPQPLPLFSIFIIHHSRPD